MYVYIYIYIHNMHTITAWLKFLSCYLCLSQTASEISPSLLVCSWKHIPLGMRLMLCFGGYLHYFWPLGSVLWWKGIKQYRRLQPWIGDLPNAASTGLTWGPDKVTPLSKVVPSRLEGHSVGDKQCGGAQVPRMYSGGRAQGQKVISVPQEEHKNENHEFSLGSLTLGRSHLLWSCFPIWIMRKK